MEEEIRNNKKQSILLALGLIAFIGLVGGVTYAFFNYTRTGAGNTIRVGRIAFISRQTETISLTNLFPIDPTETGIMDDEEKVGTLEIEIEGDTDYVDGVEYLISTVNSSITSNGKTIPISLDVTVTNLGTSSDSYWTAREDKNATIYKKIIEDTLTGDEQVLVGYIKPNTTSGTKEGVNGKITIKAYLDKNKILISDTYNNGEEPTDNMGTPVSMGEGKTVFTTTEWNALSSSGISFQVKIEANEGIWVKEPLTAVGQIIKKVNTATQINFAIVSSASNGEGLYILPGTESDVNPIYYYRGAVTDNNVIFGGFCWQIVRTTNTGGIKMIYNGVATGDGKTCENTTGASRQLATTSAFNTNYQSVSDVGYMYNQRYPYTNGAAASNSIYGKNVEWNDTTSTYLVIEDTSGTASTNTTKDANHHYSCGTASTSSCASVRYYYYNDYYITLTGGDTIEDALYKMTGNGSASTKAKNTGYKLNTTDSTAKAEIENWFKTNLTNEVDASKTNYQEYLEDTVFCNDRSYKTTGSSNSNTYIQSGWNPNGGHLQTYLYFGTRNRFNNSNWYSEANVPSMACENVTDRFSVSNQEAKLKYPVGLLTADEIILAGAAGNSMTSNNTYYLYTGNYYWSLSPYGFYTTSAVGSNLNRDGFLGDNGVSENYLYRSFGLRPVVSLKLGTEFEDGGVGTALKPYVVKTSE